MPETTTTTNAPKFQSLTQQICSFAFHGRSRLLWRFETVPPGRQPFVVLRKMCAAGMIVIVQESQFETVPLR
jgi:hypothetical protein